MAQGIIVQKCPELKLIKHDQAVDDWNREMARTRTIFSCSSLDRIAISRRIRLTTETCDGMDGEQISIEQFVEILIK
jgi:hypothetical protein